MVIYYETGSFNVKLTASNSLYTNSFELKNVVQISTTPVVNFIYIINSNKVSFTNNTQNGNSYEWDFGDGTFSNESNPVHIYANKGVYIVKLIATNDCGKEISEKHWW